MRPVVRERGGWLASPNTKQEGAHFSLVLREAELCLAVTGCKRSCPPPFAQDAKDGTPISLLIRNGGLGRVECGSLFCRRTIQESDQRIRAAAATKTLSVHTVNDLKRPPTSTYVREYASRPSQLWTSKIAIIASFGLNF